MEETYKQNLLSDDKDLQFDAISKIRLTLVTSNEPAARLAYARTLIDMDIPRILCHFVGVTDLEMSRTTLCILQMTSECAEFYTKNIALRAFTHILQKGRQFVRDEEDDHLTIPPICNTLSVLLRNAVHHRVTVKLICNIDSLLDFINELDLDEIPHYLYILAVTNLYASIVRVLKNIHREKKLDTIIEIHRKVLEAANNTMKVLVRNCDPRHGDLMAPITIICNAGMRYYEISGKSRHSTRAIDNCSDSIAHSNPLRPIFDITRDTLLDNVFPNSLCIEVTTQLYSASSINFTTCLCHVYSCDDIDQTQFSWEITKYGYLKYLHAMLNPSQSYQESLCGALAQIAVDVSHKYLAMDRWTSGLQGFLMFMKSGLMTWLHSPSPDIDSLPPDALLFLMYIHFHATQQFQLIDYIQAITALKMSQRIMDISVDKIPEIPTLQVILFLFAASTLARPSEDHEELFPVALSRMTQILAKVGLENCHVENRTIPIFVLEGSVFSNGIPDNTVELWLKFEDNIYLLITPGSNNALIECLLNSVHSDPGGFVMRCPWKLLRMLDYSVNSLMSLGGQLIQSLWANLPAILTAHTEERERSTELYLGMLNRTIISNILEMTAVIDCAKTTIDILLQNNIELSINLRTLITQQAARVLQGAYLSLDDRVVWFFVNNCAILAKLRDQAYDAVKGDLAAASFECLAAILRSQTRFRVECSQPVVIRRKNLLAPLMPHEFGYFDVLDFYDQMLMCEVERPAFVIDELPAEDIEDIVEELYGLYCVIHINAHETDWDITFHCLANILRFLDTDYGITLHICCEYACNAVIANSAVESKFYSTQFFDFARVWLRMSLKCNIPSVRDVLETRQDRTKTRERNCFESSFLKALYGIEKLVEEAIELRRLRKENATKLLEYLGELL